MTKVTDRALQCTGKQSKHALHPEAVQQFASDSHQKESKRLMISAS